MVDYRQLLQRRSRLQASIDSLQAGRRKLAEKEQQHQQLLHKPGEYDRDALQKALQRIHDNLSEIDVTLQTERETLEEVEADLQAADEILAAHGVRPGDGGSNRR